MMFTTVSRLLAVLAVILLGACGQSGPLYLPGNPSEIQVEAPPPETATDEILEDEENEARE